MVALELIDAQVRDAVRRRGIDPATDPSAVRGLVEEIVRAYDERSLTGAVPVLEDVDGTTQHVYDAVAGYGLLQRYFDDRTVEEIWINEPGRVFVAREGRTELTTTILTAQAIRDLVERMLKPSGRRLDLSSPFVDALLQAGRGTVRKTCVTSRGSCSRFPRLSRIVRANDLATTLTGRTIGSSTTYAGALPALDIEGWPILLGRPQQPTIG